MSLQTVPVDVTSSDPTDVLVDGAIRVRGLGVPHGRVPAVGYRMDVGDASIAFSSDQNGSNPAWTDLIQGVDVLVAHFAVSESTPSTSESLHARPFFQTRAERDAPMTMMAVAYQTEPTFRPATAVALFDGPYRFGIGSFDVSGDSGRFLMIEEAAETADQVEVIVVQNWLEELKRLVPVD